MLPVPGRIWPKAVVGPTWEFITNMYIWCVTFFNILPFFLMLQVLYCTVLILHCFQISSLKNISWTSRTAVILILCLWPQIFSSASAWILQTRAVCTMYGVFSILQPHLCLWDILLWDILLWDILLQLYTSTKRIYKPPTISFKNTLSKKYVNKYFEHLLFKRFLCK
jgi:hypothetical protein